MPSLANAQATRNSTDSNEHQQTDQRDSEASPSEHDQPEHQVQESVLHENVLLPPGSAGDPIQSEAQTLRDSNLQQPGTSLLDLPPELTEAICVLALTHNPGEVVDVQQKISGGLRIGSHPICRVNKRLRHESLVPYLRSTRFGAKYSGEEGNNARILAQTQRWPTMLGSASLQHVRLLSLSGYPPGDGSIWKCAMDFQHGTLDMADLPWQKQGPFMRWSMRHAFLKVTGAGPWLPTAEGLNVLFQTFAIGFSKNPGLLTEDGKLAELMKRFPQVYTDDVKVDLWPVEHKSGERYLKIPGKYAPRLWRYVS